MLKWNAHKMVPYCKFLDECTHTFGWTVHEFSSILMDVNSSSEDRSGLSVPPQRNWNIKPCTPAAVHTHTHTARLPPSIWPLLFLFLLFFSCSFYKLVSWPCSVSAGQYFDVITEHMCRSFSFMAAHHHPHPHPHRKFAFHAWLWPPHLTSKPQLIGTPHLIKSF